MLVKSVYIVSIVFSSKLPDQKQLREAKSEQELEGINVIGRRMSDTAIIKGEHVKGA